MSAGSSDVSNIARISPDILKIWYDAFNDMTATEMIEVEYLETSDSNEWKLIYANRRNFAGGKLCTLCDIVLNTSHIMEHSNGKKHRANIEMKVHKLRHPSINPETLKNVDSGAVNADAVKITEMKEKLKNEMTSMNLIDMELIEYKFDNTEWSNLFSKNDVGYVCNMCKSYTLINLKIIRNHLQTAKHKNNLNLIQGLYHPNLAPIKDLLEKPVEIKDDKLSDILKNPSSVFQKKAKDLIEKHAEINIDLLLQIEIQHKLTDKWEKLISKPNNTNQCTCTVCKINIVGISELRKHLRIDSHVKNINNLNGIHHPILAPLKNTVATTAIPITESLKTLAPGKDVDLSAKNQSGTKKTTVIPTTESVIPTTKSIGAIIESTVPVIKSSVPTIKGTVPSIKSIAPTIKTEINSEPAKIVELSANKKDETIKSNTVSQIKTTIPTTKGNSDAIVTEKQTSKDNAMSDKDFRNIIATLKHSDLTITEFYKENVWRKMIIFGDRTYNCVLCNVRKISNFKCLVDHLKGKKHLFAMTTVPRLYHPTKTMAKSDKDLVAIKPPIDKSLKPKEQNQKDTENISNDTENNIITTEVITVEDSPEREIGIQAISTDLKEEENNDAIKKSINKELSTTNLNSMSDTHKIKNDKKKIINKEKDKSIISDNVLNNESNKDHDVVIVNKESENIVLNPVAVIATRNLNKTNEGAQYQQNRIIVPRYKSGQNTTTDVTTTPSKVSNRAEKTQHFSTKTLTNSTDNSIEGLIGVEYVVKIIQHAADDIPRFECCLCEIELGGVAMQNHLRNLKHRLKYLDRHFQTCVKQYKDHRNDGIIMTEIVDRIAKAIEKYHGRDLPYECVQSDYRRNRQDIMAKVFSFRHASELLGPSFTNIVDKKCVDDIIRNKHKLGERIPDIDKRKTTFDKENTDNSKRQRIHSPKRSAIFPNRNSTPKQHYPFINPGQQSVSQTLPQFPHSYDPSSQTYPVPYNPIQNQIKSAIDDEEHRRLSENFIKNTKIRETRSPLLKRRPSPRRHRSRSPQRRYGRSRSPPRRHVRDRRRSLSRSPLREGDVWQAYRRKFDIDVKILDLDYEGYNKDPQSYPLYNEEWQNFWAKRMNELKAERKDHQGYDFTSEWALYFPRRLKELYENDVEELKVRLRERFVLPMHNRELKDKRYFIKGTYEDNELDIEEAPLPPIIRSNYQDYSFQRRRSRSHARSISRSRSRSSHNYKIKTDPDCEILSLGDDNTQQTAHKKKTTKNNNDDEDRIDFGPLTVVSVLRLLTALEDNLGSLGPRVVDLLSKALTLEKIKPNHSDEILLTVENCVFLETCSEKLKGQVLAGVITTTKLRAVRQAIKDITAMVRKANEERAKKPAPKPPQVRKPQIIQKVVTAPVIQKIQTPTNLTELRGNANNQSSNNKQTVPQPQHPTVMSQAQKKDLASKLAAALAAQGKTDISTENCERLIEVYAMIDKKKSETENRSAGNREKQSLSDTLTDILSSGNLSALSTLFQSNRQQSGAVISTASRDNNSGNQLNPNQVYHNPNNNFGFNTIQNRFGNNFNQLANFDTSLNLASGFDRQQINSTHNQMNFNTGGGGLSSQIWQNLLPQGNNQNWISGNNIAQQLLLRGSLNQPNVMSGNNQNSNSSNLLSQTLLNSSHLRNNIGTGSGNASNPRIDTCAQNSPAFATGASYRGKFNKSIIDTVSYPNLWHRQNQSNSVSMSGNNRTGGNTENPAIGFTNREQLLNQQQNLLANRYRSYNIDERNLSNSGPNARTVTNQNRRSDFTGRR